MTITFWGGLVQIILPIEWAVKDHKGANIPHGSKIHFNFTTLKYIFHLWRNLTFLLIWNPTEKEIECNLFVLIIYAWIKILFGLDYFWDILMDIIQI